MADRDLPNSLIIGSPTGIFTECLVLRLFGESFVILRDVGNNVGGSLSSLARLSTHTRYLFTLRSDAGAYHSLLLFRLAGLEEGVPSLYVMESACPHLGADLSHAEIEECGTDVVAVCPWHR